MHCKHIILTIRLFLFINISLIFDVFASDIFNGQIKAKISPNDSLSYEWSLAYSFKTHLRTWFYKNTIYIFFTNRFKMSVYIRTVFITVLFKAKASSYFRKDFVESWKKTWDNLKIFNILKVIICRAKIKNLYKTKSKIKSFLRSKAKTILLTLRMYCLTYLTD